MPQSYIGLPGNGSNTNFNFSFGYLSRSHIHVFVDNVETPFTWLSDFSIQITPAPANGSIVEIRRITPVDQQPVLWTDGSTITEKDMNLEARFNLYVHQEARDATVESNRIVLDTAAALTAAFGAMGFLPPVKYTAGLTIKTAAQTVSYDGEVYAPIMDKLPFTTSGTFETDKFYLVSGVKASDLASTNPALGATMVGRNVVSVDSIPDLLALPEVARREDLRYLVKGHHAGSDVGGGEFFWDAASTEDDNGGIVLAPPGVTVGRFVRWYSGPINVHWFGAKGDDNQALYPTSYTVDGVTITQQTADGLAINKAISYLRSIGGGSLHFPRGIYRVYGYLEALDFPVRVHGDGPGVTILQNCDDSPTDRNGYGVFVCNPTGPDITNISFADLTVDGNAEVRTKPTGEYRSYPLSPTGFGFYSLNNVHLLNSPIDCLRTGYVNDVEGTGLVAINCKLSNSYRNTLSCVSGWNQSWTNCVIEKGGKVHGGTNPRFCLDIEPVNSSNPIRNLTFTSCTFQDAANVVVGGTWGEAKFIGCTINAYGDPQERNNYPWMVTHAQGHYDYLNCNFYSDNGRKFIHSSGENPSPGYFADTQYLRLAGCHVEGGGLQAIGPRTIVEDTVFKNSAYQIRLIRSNYPDEPHELVLKNVTLINVFNFYTDGDRASFVTFNGSYGPIYVDGLRIVFDPTQLNDVMRNLLAGETPSSAYGFRLRTTNWPADRTFIFKNIHIEGFQQRLPQYLGVAPDVNSFRDWRVPDTAPPDSEGQVTTPGVPFYKNCTMHGDNP